MLTRDENHIYRWNGNIVPGLSEILNEVLENGQPFPEWVKPSLVKGTIVHKIIEFHLLQKLDESTIDPLLQGYFDSFRKWQDKVHFKANMTEVMLYNTRHNFACQIDSEGVTDDGPCIPDWKTGGVYPKYKYQMTMQKMAVNMDKIDHKLFILQLFKDGKQAKPHYYDYVPQDAAAIIRTYHLKKAYMEAKNGK